MDSGVRKEVENNFKTILQKVRNIYDIEKENIDFGKFKDIGKIVSQYEELYDEWIEFIETVPLPEIEKIETIEHIDGPYVKVNYILNTEEGKLLRKVRIKSNGKVNIYNNIIFEDIINGETFVIVVEYDNYGNLIFFVERK